MENLDKKLKVVGLIPARSGSKRVPDKNIRPLNGHPLLAYSVNSAIKSGVFDEVICVTDSPLYAEIARHYGAIVPTFRPTEISGDKSPDIEWVVWILNFLENQGKVFDAFSILRPTSPLRSVAAIRKAMDLLIKTGAHSIRAVEKCGQHPGKMWLINGDYMQPLLPFKNSETPWHSSQYTMLPEIYVQNASLEIAWTRIVSETGSIAGQIIAPFKTDGFEGVDVNEEFDWVYLEYLFSTRQVQMPEFNVKPWLNNK